MFSTQNTLQHQAAQGFGRERVYGVEDCRGSHSQEKDSGEEGLEKFDDLFTSMKLKILRVKHFSRTNKIRAK